MHDILRCIPVAGVFIGIFGSIATAEASPAKAFVLMGAAVASVAYMRWEGNYGLD